MVPGQEIVHSEVLGQEGAGVWSMVDGVRGMARGDVTRRNREETGTRTHRVLWVILRV